MTLTPVLRRTAAAMRLPTGFGILFDTGTRWRLLACGLGAVMSASLDMLGVLTLLPLMQLLTGSGSRTGALGAVDTLLGGDSTDSQLAIAIGSLMIAAFTGKAIIVLSFRWWQMNFIAEQEAKTSVRLLSGYLGAPYATFVRRSQAEFMRALSDSVSAAYNGVVGPSLVLLTEALTLGALIALLLVTSPLAATAAIAWFALTLVPLNRFVRRRSIDLGEKSVNQKTRLWGALVHPIGGAREIMLRHNAQVFEKELSDAKLDAARTGLRQSLLGDLPKYLLELAFVVGLALMAVLIFWRSASDEAVVTLALFAGAGTRLLPSLVRLSSSLSAIRFGVPLARLAVEDLHEFDTPLSPASNQHLPPSDLKLERVTFSYPTSARPALDGVSVEVPRGTSLAVVGPSGSGKSTLVDVILGLHRPDQGRVLVGGRDISDDMASWQGSIGMVPQDVWWNRDTIAGNIAFGVPPEQRDPERLARAIERAHLTDVIEELPEGLDTMLGDRGVRLSGGQRQRVGIARALYLDPNVLVFDEATSALDNLTEHRVTETLNSLSGETTLVVVAHRLSTVRGCDQLIYMDGGKIVASGTFDEVRERSPEFARLVELGSLDAWARPNQGSVAHAPPPEG